MATGEVELIGTQVQSGNFSGFPKENAIDGDVTTFWLHSSVNGGWLGIDAGEAVTVTRYRYAPRPGDATDDWERWTKGATCQGATASDFSDAVTYDTIPTLQWPHRYNYTQRSTTSPAAKRYWRLAGINNSYGGHWAELRFIANAGTSATAKPCAPVISPSGGRFPTGSKVVTVTSLTTSAAIYYTTDGTTPTTASTLYSGPITVTATEAGRVIKAIAHDATLSTTTSDVTTSAPFYNFGLSPSVEWYDTEGRKLEFHGGGGD